MKRSDAEFRVLDGTVLRGWLYKPDASSPKHPVIVMTNGFSGIKESVAKYAEVFCQSGLAVLLYDNRNFGASDGSPRLHIDPYQQIADFRDAISFVEQDASIDKGRIGIWGTSYAGGHVLVIGANDKRVKCIVSQVPFISGHLTGPRFFPVDRMASLRRLFQEEREKLLRGEQPSLVPVLAEDGGIACLPPPVSKRFMDATRQDTPEWRNEVTITSLEKLLEYDPGSCIRFVSPTPLLMVIAKRDTITFADLALEAYHAALEPKRLFLHGGGHWATYYPPHFEETSGAARNWFLQHLVQGA
jgi:fermentation-respiration switch protein FrsA (DUF1100 family)